MDMMDSFNWTVEDFELGYYELGYCEEDSVRMAKDAWEALHPDAE